MNQVPLLQLDYISYWTLNQDHTIFVISAPCAGKKLTMLSNKYNESYPIRGMPIADQRMILKTRSQNQIYLII